MQIEAGNRKISSVYFTDTEEAWKIEDAFSVLEYFKNKGRIVLGGDILTENLDYTYDNWYYNIQPLISMEENKKNSIKTATEYIADYINRNGRTFYIVFVVN